MNYGVKLKTSSDKKLKKLKIICCSLAGLSTIMGATILKLTGIL